MTQSDKRAFKRMLGGKVSGGVSTDDLQGLLLQIVFALLMVFMIAYFIFVESAKKIQEEQLIELNHQKLVIAIEKASEDYRVKYGINALMTQGTDGKRVFDADELVKSGKIDFAPAAKSAFSVGSAAAYSDYSNVETLRSQWLDAVLASAELKAEEVTVDEMKWLEKQIGVSVENMRLDARGVQRALAARLQEALIARPEQFGGVRDAAALAAELKVKSLDMVKEFLGTEVLP